MPPPPMALDPALLREQQKRRERRQLEKKRVRVADDVMMHYCQCSGIPIPIFLNTTISSRSMDTANNNNGHDSNTSIISLMNNDDTYNNLNGGSLALTLKIPLRLKRNSDEISNKDNNNNINNQNSNIRTTKLFKTSIDEKLTTGNFENDNNNNKYQIQNGVPYHDHNTDVHNKNKTYDEISPFLPEKRNNNIKIIFKKKPSKFDRKININEKRIAQRSIFWSINDMEEDNDVSGNNILNNIVMQVY